MILVRFASSCEALSPTSSHDEALLLAANQAFYEAFARRDLRALETLWATESPVVCVHPGWDVLVGRDAVMASWRELLASDGMRIECSEPRAYVAGELAYVVCLEGVSGEAPMLVATNVFAREGGEWRLVHHHAGQLARPARRAPARPAN